MTLTTTSVEPTMPKFPDSDVGVLEYHTFMQGVKAGLKARMEGRVIPLSQVMEEFGLE